MREHGHTSPADWISIQRDLGIALGKGVGFDETLHLCLDAALKGSSMDAGGIYLFNETTSTLNLLAHNGLSSLFLNKVERMGSGTNSVQIVLAGEPKYFQDYNLQMPPDDPRAKEGLRSAAVIPLKKDGRVIGSLNLGSRTDSKIPEAVKPGLELIARQVCDAIVRKQAEDALKESEDRYRSVSELTSDYAYCYRVGKNGELEIEWVTGALVKITGFTREELSGLGGWESLIYPDDMPIPLKQLKELLSGRKSIVEYRILTKERKLRWMRDYGRPEMIDGQVAYLYGAVQDISEQRRLEEQVNQLRKMEAIGQLAGGIAHDFNNMLSPILGYADYILQSQRPGDPFFNEIMSVREAAKRAAEITGQLMAFSRKRVFKTEVIDLNREVTKLYAMLRRLIGENVDFLNQLPPDPVCVEADPSQIQQILINLAVNARDSMPDGGALTVEVKKVEISSKRTYATLSAAPGLFAQISVKDTGEGISTEVIPHIFEPFFTTKQRDRGTGLGLATVYGIVQQHEGFIEVDSIPGNGSTFKVYFPLSQKPPPQQEPELTVPNGASGTWTVLVVEDDHLVREFVCKILEYEGYSVLSAADPSTALEIGSAHPEKIDLIITDVVMPGLNGGQVYDQLKTSWPDLEVLFISGYAGGVPIVEKYLKAGKMLLQKPFTVKQLVDTLEQLSSQITA